MARKKARSAYSALVVISWPHVGPTSLMLTWDGWTWATDASLLVTACFTWACWAAEPELTLASTSSVFPPRTVMVGSGTPTEPTAERAWLTLTFGATTCHDVPPLNSIPKLRPFTPSETEPTTITTADSRNQRHRLPTKSKAVSPRYRRDHRPRTPPLPSLIPVSPPESGRGRHPAWGRVWRPDLWPRRASGPR